MFELAEGLTILKEKNSASKIYQELSEIPPETMAKQQIAEVSRERLQHLDQYLGNMKLMPPWPSEAGNCVICHAKKAEVSIHTLYTKESFVTAPPKEFPKHPKSNFDAKKCTSKEPSQAPIPEGLNDFLHNHCSPCHFPGGRMHDLIPLDDSALVRGCSEEILETVDEDVMPPQVPLIGSEKQRLMSWIQEL